MDPVCSRNPLTCRCWRHIRPKPKLSNVLCGVSLKQFEIANGKEHQRLKLPPPDSLIARTQRHNFMDEAVERESWCRTRIHECLMFLEWCCKTKRAGVKEHRPREIGLRPLCQTKVDLILKTALSVCLDHMIGTKNEEQFGYVLRKEFGLPLHPKSHMIAITPRGYGKTVATSFLIAMQTIFNVYSKSPLNPYPQFILAHQESAAKVIMNAVKVIINMAQEASDEVAQMVGRPLHVKTKYRKDSDRTREYVTANGYITLAKAGALTQNQARSKQPKIVYIDEAGFVDRTALMKGVGPWMYNPGTHVFMITTPAEYGSEMDRYFSSIFQDPDSNFTVLRLGVVPEDMRHEPIDVKIKCRRHFDQFPFWKSPVKTVQSFGSADYKNNQQAALIEIMGEPADAPGLCFDAAGIERMREPQPADTFDIKNCAKHILLVNVDPAHNGKTENASDFAISSFVPCNDHLVVRERKKKKRKKKYIYICIILQLRPSTPCKTLYCCEPLA